MGFRIGEKTKKRLRIGAKVGGIALTLAGAKGYLGKKEDTTTTPTPYPEPAGATAIAPPAQVIPQPSAPQGVAPQIASQVGRAGAGVFTGEISKKSAVKEVVKAGLHVQPKPEGQNIAEMIRKAEEASKARSTKITKKKANVREGRTYKPDRASRGLKWRKKKTK